MSSRHSIAASMDRRPLRRNLHISAAARDRYGVTRSLVSLRGTVLMTDLSAAQMLAQRMNEVREIQRFPQLAVRAGEVYAAGLLHEAMHLLVEAFVGRGASGLFERLAHGVGLDLGADALRQLQRRFAATFPAPDVAGGEQSVEDYLDGSTGGTPNREIVLEEMLLLRLSNENPALERLIELFDDSELVAGGSYLAVIAAIEGAAEKVPGSTGSASLLDLLRAPMRASPTSLIGQLAYMREHWHAFLGDGFAALVERMLTSIDVLREETRPRSGGPGPSQVPDAAALRGAGPEEYERFSSDLSWMPRVVLQAKSIYVWLDQLSTRYGSDIATLDAIPDAELDALAAAGFTGLWLIGLWERSEASRRIKHLRGQPDAVASAYALHDYRIAGNLGGEDAYRDLRERSWVRGIRLASDMVPNHVGIDGRWVIEHPDRFLQLEEPPFPGYSFSGPDLSSDDRVGVYIDDHYYDNSDAAVVFKRVDRSTGEVRYIYHGNDGTSMPWNDTAQIDYLNPEAREAVIQTILEVARLFPIIRFDAAMTLAKQHVQRLWFPAPGSGGAIPSRAATGAMTTEEFERRMGGEFWREVVDRVAAEVPETLLLAEAFWMMEGYFVRTLGMHRVYNSAFMHMLKEERNGAYRTLIKNVLEFDPQILKRYVNFMNNPDEETALAQFGRDGKYFGVAIVLSTLPGLPMFGHGQIEGLSEKYGMEYRRAKLDEQPDQELVARHRREIFPLLHRRAQFAEVDNFLLYDLVTPEGYVSEDVIAYSNRVGERVSLVLFHNRYAAVRGWIRRSSAYLDKGRASLQQRDLFDGFALDGGHDRFVVLHEHLAGRDSLLRSERVRHEGLFVELDGYGCRVYLDVREVVDHDGSLALLDAELAGASVPSVDDALHDLRLRPLHAALTALLDRLDGAGGIEVADAGTQARTPDRGDTPAAPQTSTVEASADSETFAANEPATVTALEANLRRQFEAADVGPEPESASAAGLVGAQLSPSTAAALLRRFGVTPNDVDRLRLVPFFERRWQGGPHEAGAEAALVVVLLAALSAPAAVRTAEQILAHLVELPVLARALAVNSFGGREWFAAERFERLVGALAESLASGAKAAALRERLQAIGERAEYRFDMLVAPAPAGSDRGEPPDVDGEERSA